MMDNTLGAQMEEQLYSLRLFQVKMKETSKRHGKILTEILPCLENLRSAEISTRKASQANHVVVEPGLRHYSSQDDDLIGFCGSGQSVSFEDDLIRFGDLHLCNSGNVGLGDPHPCNSGNGLLSDQENHHVESISMKDFVFLNENVVDYDAACSPDSSSCKYSYEGILFSDRIWGFNGVDFDDKIQKFLRQFRVKLDESLIINVLIEVPMLIRLIRYYACWAGKIHGLVGLADRPRRVQTLHKPTGVIGHIIPWYFPLLIYPWKVGPSFTCGNTYALTFLILLGVGAFKLFGISKGLGLNEEELPSMKSNTIPRFVRFSKDVFQGPLTNWKKNGVVGSVQGAFMLCRIFQKSGSGLKNVDIQMAHQLFDEMPCRMLFARIALISGYVYFYVSVVGANTHISEVSDDEMMYGDGPTHNQPPIEEEFFIEMDELSNRADVGASGFEMLDEFLPYFDATNDNLYHVPLDSSSNLSERVDFNSYPLVLR